MARGRIVQLEAIIGEQIGHDGGTEYLAKWANFPIEEATWEPAENFEEAQDALDTWEREKKELKQLPEVGSDAESSLPDSSSGHGVPPSQSRAGSNADVSIVAQAEDDYATKDQVAPSAEDEPNLLQRVRSTSSREAEPAPPLRRRASAGAILSAHRTQRTTEKAHDERSESDDSAIPLPPGHTLPAEPSTPRAIIGERDDGCFLVTWEHRLASGKPLEPSWVGQKHVSVALIRVWDKLKDDALPADDETAALSDRYDVSMKKHVLLITPKVPQKPSGNPYVSSNGRQGADEEDEFNVPGPSVTGDESIREKPVASTLGAKSTTRAVDVSQMPLITAEQAAEILVQMANSRRWTTRESGTE
ncbi:hypothetical protein LTR85_000824 [Meristemomyces frigidus]|nr:hypothetical protein LTR85_000824 [Meristemomyces frigidus]